MPPIIEQATSRNDEYLLSDVSAFLESFFFSVCIVDPEENRRGYRCAERNYCFSYPETTSTLTYSDEKLSTVYEVWYYAATPIQIRFKAEESDIVPVPTGSFSLPREFLYTREKVGIGIGVTAAVGLASLAIYYCWFVRRRRRAAAAAEAEFAHQQLTPLVPQDGQGYDLGPPPPYPGHTGDINPKR